MKNWTRARRVSFAVHAAFVSVPFTLSTASALLFWYALFQRWFLAVPMVAVIDVLALTGLVLYVARIPSPFVRLRHLLPFISIVPLGRELYLLLAHNDPAVAWSITILTTAILVVIAWQCFRTIERLFIDPVTAARERAHEQVAHLAQTLAQLREMETVVDAFAEERMVYRSEVRQIAPPDDAPLAQIAPPPVEDVLVVARQELSMRQLASRIGVPESTLRRKLAQNGAHDVAPD